MIVSFDSSQTFKVDLSIQVFEGVFVKENAPPIPVVFRENESFDVALSADDFTVDFSDMHSAGEYNGPCVVTPSSDTQTLYTINKNMTQNVVVEPIPSNYGLITWDGHKITVS